MVMSWCIMGRVVVEIDGCCCCKGAVTVVCVIMARGARVTVRIVIGRVAVVCVMARGARGGAITHGWRATAVRVWCRVQRRCEDRGGARSTRIPRTARATAARGPWGVAPRHVLPQDVMTCQDHARLEPRRRAVLGCCGGRGRARGARRLGGLEERWHSDIFASPAPHCQHGVTHTGRACQKHSTRHHSPARSRRTTWRRRRTRQRAESGTERQLHRTTVSERQ